MLLTQRAQNQFSWIEVTKSANHNHQSQIAGDNEDITSLAGSLKAVKIQHVRHSHWLVLIEKNSVCRLPLLTKSRNGCVSTAVSRVPSCSALHREKRVPQVFSYNINFVIHGS